MDKLKKFLLQLSIGERDDFAQRCGTTWPFLRNISYGYRVAGEKLCVRIEQESQGVVSRQDLRPDDWPEVWPELLPEAPTPEPSHA